MNNITNSSPGRCDSAKNRTMTRGTKRLIFYILLMIVPVTQFVIFYGYVNFNSIIMAFKKYDFDSGKFVYTFKNFQEAFQIIGENGDGIKNSFILYAVNLFIVMGLALVFSYYIAKNYAFSGTFRVVLYMPQIVSSIIFVLLYKTLTVSVSEKLFGFELLTDPDTQFITILIFNIWLGFGTNVMLFTGSMSAISPSVIESAQIDGVNIVQEFIHITIPSVWGTFVTFVVVGIANIFLNQMHLYTFFGSKGAETGLSTFGYYFYQKTQAAANSWTTPTLNKAAVSLNTLSATGFIITVVLVPTTLFVKHLLEKYGPRTD